MVLNMKDHVLTTSQVIRVLHITMMLKCHKRILMSSLSDKDMRYGNLKNLQIELGPPPPLCRAPYGPPLCWESSPLSPTLFKKVPDRRFSHFVAPLPVINDKSLSKASLETQYSRPGNRLVWQVNGTYLEKRKKDN